MEFMQKIRKTMWLVDDGFGEIFSGSVAEAFCYFVMMLCIGLSVLSIANFLEGKNVIFGALVNASITFFGWVLVMPLFAHYAMVALGGKGDLRDTFKAYWYGSTPMFLFGWVPCVGIFSIFVSLGNVVRALNKVNNVSYGNAIFVVLASFGVFFALCLAAAYVLFAMGLVSV